MGQAQRTVSVPNDLNPFVDRPDEWHLYQTLVGDSMLELGCKANGTRAYKTFFEAIGYRHVSVDWNGKFGSVALDLRLPLDLGQFDMVTNIGTTEHVEDQEPVWRNIIAALHPGSVFISTTPAPGQWPKHGHYYPTPEFYIELADKNALIIERLYLVGEQPRRMWYFRAIRAEDAPFVMPTAPIFHNLGGKPSR